MSRGLIAMAAGGLALVLTAAPLGVLHSQVVAPGTNPRQRTDTTATTRTPTTQPTTPQTAATGQVATAQAMRDEMMTDLPFIREAASANLMEIQLGQQAQSKASNQAVKQFGDRMVTDHTRLEQQLSSMVSRNSIAFDAVLNSEHQQQVNRLQSLSGTEFDQAYMSMMIQDHQNDVNKFEQQSRAANSPQVRALAGNSLPVLQQHLTLAQQVGGQVNARMAAVSPANRADRAKFMADAKFIRENTADNYLEVSLGRLAENKAQNSAVREFGQRIVKDHNRLQDEWVRVASENGLIYKTGIGKLHREKLTKLEKLSGREFDRAFMTMEIQNHKDYINYLEREGRAAKSAQVRGLVDNTLPTLRNHFTEAKQIGAQVGADTNVTLRSEGKK